MTADNVKTAFVFSLGLTKTLSTTSHEKVFRNIHRKRPTLRSLCNKVSGLQPAALSKKRFRHRYFPVKLLRTGSFIEHLRTTALEEHEILLKTVPIAIPNDISEAFEISLR